MNTKPNRSLRLLAHPYIFVLREGKEIIQNPLDYSLMMLFIHSNETIHSPGKERSLVLKKPKT